MANSEWWQRVVQARTQHDDLLPQRVRPGTARQIDRDLVPVFADRRESGAEAEAFYFLLLSIYQFRSRTCAGSFWFPLEAL